MGHLNYGCQNTHNTDKQELIRRKKKKAGCPHETLVYYKPVMFLFTDYNVLPAEKYDNREE